MADIFGALLGFTLTLLIFSYLLGDNPLFRLAIHVFVGVTAGYAVVITYYNVIKPQLIDRLLFGSVEEHLLTLFPLLLCLLMLTKLSPRLNWLGNPSLAFMVGVGVAAAIGGAVMGTIFPQVSASISLFGLENQEGSGLQAISSFAALINGSLVLIGTVSTLAYFHFGVHSQSSQPLGRSRWIEGLALLGQFFIAVTFGLLFAGVYMAALAAFIERIYSIWSTFKMFGF